MFYRIVEYLLAIKLKTDCFIIISGPAGCGKSSIAIKYSNSILNIGENFASNILLAEFDIDKLLVGDKPRLIEGYDLIDDLLNEIESKCNLNSRGLFILTTRQIVEDSIKMFPLSLFESGESSGRISILELFENQDIDIQGFESNIGIGDLIRACCRGGFPESFVFIMI